MSDYDDIDRKLYKMQQRMDDWEEKMKQGFEDINKSLIMLSQDEFIAEHFDEYFHLFTFKKSRSMKFRKCIVTGLQLYPGTIAYKGVLQHDERERVIWVSSQEMLFRLLKKDYNA